MKTKSLIIIGIVITVGILGITYGINQFEYNQHIKQREEFRDIRESVLDEIKENKIAESKVYSYDISGQKGGAGSHTKEKLIFSRTNTENPSDTHTVELTKDLYYTDLILFSDWKVHSFENYVFVSWITSEQSWSDVFLAVSDDYGETFDVKNISQSKEFVHQYKVDYSKETIYFVWQHQFITEENVHFGQIYFTKSDNFGDSFGQQKLLSSFDRPAYEFELEAFADNVFVAWRQDVDTQDEKNMWFASTDRAEYFMRESKLLAANIDADSYNDVLHLTWVDADDDDQIWYAYSEDVGQTLHSKIVFDADWKLSPYAQRPNPKDYCRRRDHNRVDNEQQRR